MSENQIVVYQPNETVRLDVRLESDTVWLTQAQLCDLFKRDVSVISRHIKNIFTEGELEKESNLHFLQSANSDRPIALYSLIDDKTLYLVGASLKDLGWKCFAFTKLDAAEIPRLKANPTILVVRFPHNWKLALTGNAEKW